MLAAITFFILFVRIEELINGNIQQSDNFIKGIHARVLTTIFKLHNGTGCTINELREVFLCPAFGFSFAFDLPA